MLSAVGWRDRTWHHPLAGVVEVASKLKDLIVEIHRRSLWQVIGIFLVGGWIAFEAVQTLTEGLGLPDWFPALALVLLVVFFPIVLATAFVQEGMAGRTPEVAKEASPTGSDAPGTEGRPGQADSPQAPPGGAGSPPHEALTWRNALLGGVVSILILGGSGVGYVGLRYAGVGPFGTLMAKGDWDERDRIVLADFENRTTDSLIAYGATEWFRVALTQSSVVSLAGGNYLAGVLERMGLDPDASMDCEKSREIAIRQGLKAVVCGEVIEVGSSLMVSSELRVAETGESLWADTERAESPDVMIDAVERLSKKLRERVGESLGTILATEPLPKVTTTSMGALRQFDLGIRAVRNGDNIRGKVLLGEAVALDTTFAYAFRALGMAYNNLGEADSARMMLTRAFGLRHHATLGERFRIEGDYHSVVTLDDDAAIQALERAIEAGDSTSAGNLSLLVMSVRRDYEEAERLLSISLAQTDSAGTWLSAMAMAVAAQGRYEEAMEWYGRAVEKAGGGYASGLVRVEAARGNYDEAETPLRTLKEKYLRDPVWQAWCGENLSHLARLRGRLSEAEAHLDDAMAVQVAQGWMADAMNNALVHASMAARFRGDTLGTLKRVEETLDRWPLDSLPENQRPYDALVWPLALAGQPERARTYLEAWEATIQAETRSIRASRHYSLGSLALSEGRPGVAVQEYRNADGLESCPMCALGALAEAYDRANQPDSALAVYERFVSTPYYSRLWTDSWSLAQAYERLGQLYEARGEPTRASLYFRKFVDLWEDADPELQPRVQAAREALERLGGPSTG